RPNQKDTDSLPPYEVLDDILQALIEREQTVEHVCAQSGHAPPLVRRIAGMVMRAEYKRRQAAPGVKIHAREFGRGRRYPITSGFVYGAENTAPAGQPR
ncbi:MAG: hypothetical protein OXB87_01770, partial [Hyphomicrobiales bacterium]|nr:hypothetical protein [Hyphomicrobiales bacterium]